MTHSVGAQPARPDTLEDFNKRAEAILSLEDGSSASSISSDKLTAQLTSELTTISKVKLFFLKIASALGINTMFGVRTNIDARPEVVVDQLNDFFERNFVHLLSMDRNQFEKLMRVVSKLQSKFATHSYNAKADEVNASSGLSTRVTVKRQLGQDCLKRTIEDLAGAEAIASLPGVRINEEASPKVVVDQLKDFFKRNFVHLLSMDRGKLERLKRTVSKLQSKFATYSYDKEVRKVNAQTGLSERVIVKRLLGQDCLERAIEDLADAEFMTHIPQTGEEFSLMQIISVRSRHSATRDPSTFASLPPVVRMNIYIPQDTFDSTLPLRQSR